MARQLAHDLGVRGSPTLESSKEATVILTRIVAADIMTFSGVDPGQATEAVLVGDVQLSVAETSKDRRSSRIPELLRRLHRGKLG